MPLCFLLYKQNSKEKNNAKSWNCKEILFIFENFEKQKLLHTWWSLSIWTYSILHTGYFEVLNTFLLGYSYKKNQKKNTQKQELYLGSRHICKAI